MVALLLSLTLLFSVVLFGWSFCFLKERPPRCFGRCLLFGWGYHIGWLLMVVLFHTWGGLVWHVVALFPLVSGLLHYMGASVGHAFWWSVLTVLSYIGILFLWESFSLFAS